MTLAMDSVRADVLPGVDVTDEPPHAATRINRHDAPSNLIVRFITVARNHRAQDVSPAVGHNVLRIRTEPPWLRCHRRFTLNV
jgi:hypothetical protein